VSHSLHSLYLDGQTLKVNLSNTDRIWAIALLSILGASVLGLFITWLRYRDPIFASESIFKLPRYHQIGETSNGFNGLHDLSEPKLPEPLQGWRLRLGILQLGVLIALLSSYIAFLLLNGPTFLNIVLTAYWVLLFVAMANLREQRFCMLLFAFCQHCIDVHSTIRSVR